MGFIVKAINSLYPDAIIEIEPHLSVNGPGKKKTWNPDILVLRNEKELFIIDYESPNSSDTRVPEKDVKQYTYSKLKIPYIIITTLPKKPSPDWQLRYTSKGYWNEKHKGEKDEIRKSPYNYWYKFYRKKCSGKENMFFLNINGRKVSVEDI